MKKNINQLPSVSLINRLEKIQSDFSNFNSHFDECGFTAPISSDISSLIGTIDQVIETYYFLKNHGVK